MMSTQRVEGEISMVQSIQLGFSRSLGSATSNEANKSAMRRAEWTSTARRAVLRLAQRNIDILTQNAVSRTRFFQVQAIKTGHISVIYRQTCDILSVGSTGTAAAW